MAVEARPAPPRSTTRNRSKKCGSEVQKGNPPTERKIQRLFRYPEVSTLIKRCNDFGAGGVCVAIGELAEGLTISLDLVPKKYDGLDGTELAISESQERMAVVISPESKRPLFVLCSKREPGSGPCRNSDRDFKDGDVLERQEDCRSSAGIHRFQRRSPGDRYRRPPLPICRIPILTGCPANSPPVILRNPYFPFLEALPAAPAKALSSVSTGPSAQTAC